MENEKPKITSKSWGYLFNNFFIILSFATIAGIVDFLLGTILNVNEVDNTYNYLIDIFVVALLPTIITSYFAVKIHRNILLNEHLSNLNFNSNIIKKTFLYCFFVYLIDLITTLPSLLTYFLTYMTNGDVLHPDGFLILVSIMLVIAIIFGIYYSVKFSYYLPYFATSDESNTKGFFSDFHKKTKNFFWIFFKPALVFFILFFTLIILLETLIVSDLTTLITDVISYVWALIMISALSFAYKYKFH